MSGRFPARTALSCLLLALTLLIGGTRPVSLASGDEPKPAPKAGAANDAFGMTKIWSIQLEIPAKEYDAMQPAFGGGFGPPPKKDANKENKKRDSEKNLFGTEFPWVEANFTAAGQDAQKSRHSLCRRHHLFRLRARPEAPAQDRVRQIPAISNSMGYPPCHLHAMPLDPSKAREVLAYSLFRAAGVPAPRTAFAEVTLTVPGKHDKAYLGLFTVVEDVDARFLADRFGSDEGTGAEAVPGSRHRLPRRRLGPLQGAVPAAARSHARTKRSGSSTFAKLVNQATDEEFKKQIDSFIDVDAFLRFLAANALTANLESFFALGHNYTLYLDPKTNKFHFIPGDLEFSFANFLLMGSADQLMDLSVLKPYPGENKLPDRLLAIKEVNEKYRQIAQGT